ncbi:MAG: hypothetical protein ACRDYA_19620, partial [Egibacteraceae bacterium]
MRISVQEVTDRGRAGGWTVSCVLPSRRRTPPPAAPFTHDERWALRCSVDDSWSRLASRQQMAPLV